MARRCTTTGTGGGSRPGAGRTRTTAQPLRSSQRRWTIPQIAVVNHDGRRNLSAADRRIIAEVIPQQQTAGTALGTISVTSNSDRER